MEDYDELQDSPDLFENLRKQFGPVPPEMADPTVAAAPKPFVGPPVPDTITTSSAAEKSAPESPSFDPSKYMVSADDMKHSAETKRNLAMMGALTQNLANRQSVGNFATGRMNPNQNMSGYTKEMMDVAGQPVDQKQALLKQEMQKPEVEYMKQAIDPKSEASQMARAELMTGLGALKRIKAFQNSPVLDQLGEKANGMSAYQIKQLIDNNSWLKTAIGSAVSEDKNDAMMGRMSAMFGNKNSNAAQGTVNHDKILGTYIPRIDGAAKILGLIDSSEHGDVKSNQALLGQLNAEISRLETGSQSPGLHASEKTEMESAAAKLHNVLDTLTGNVTGVDLSHKFAQARSMVKELGGSYYRQIGDRMDFLEAGALPDQQDVFKAKRNQLQHQFAGAFGEGANVRPGAETKGAGGVPGVTSAHAAPNTKRKISSSEITEYANKHQMAEKDSKDFLRSQGYVVD